MRTRAFRAATIQEAIRLAKAQFGPDALIVDVRRIDALGPGAGREGYVEITAMPAGETDDFAPEVEERRLPPIDQLAARVRGRESPRPRRRDPAPTSFGRLREYPDEPDLEELEIDALRSLGIGEPLAGQLAVACGAASAMARHSAVVKTLQRVLTTRELGWIGHEHIVAALVGPSGVGKTTTIAKLAAAFSAGKKYRVALVTTDTYRVGGITQLRTFAEILQLPFYTVYTREDLETALAETAECDVVFIDTPGCNPYDAAMLKEMRSLIGSRTPIACYLTLAMTADFDETITVAQRFNLLNPTGLIFTKIDETRRAAALIGLVQQLRLPVNYVCTGPLVPEDISQATPALLADLLLDTLEYRFRRELV